MKNKTTALLLLGFLCFWSSLWNVQAYTRSFTISFATNEHIADYSEYGNGSLENPYIITDLHIEESTSGYLMKLRNIDVHVLIKSNLLVQQSNGVSIEINGCANITIDDNTIREGGIRVMYSTNITIINNKIKGMIWVEQSSGILIHNNEQSPSDGYGSTLVLKNSHYNIISNNNLEQNDIMITESSRNNIIHGNTINGYFSLREVDSNIIRNNIIYNTGDPQAQSSIYMSECHFNEIYDNNFFDYTVDDINEIDSWGNEIHDNTYEKTESPPNPASMSNFDNGIITVIGWLFFGIGGFVFIVFITSHLGENVDSSQKSKPKPVYKIQPRGRSVSKTIAINKNTFYGDVKIHNTPAAKKVMKKKLEKILNVSDKIRLDILKDALEMEAKVFNKMIFNWAEDFGFRIDGDYIKIGNADIERFISSLDEQFQNWYNQEKI